MALYLNIFRSYLEGFLSALVISISICGRETLLDLSEKSRRWKCVAILIHRFHHVMRSTGLAKTSLQGKVNGRGRQKKSWVDNMKAWTRLSLAESLGATRPELGWRTVV